MQLIAEARAAGQTAGAELVVSLADELDARLPSDRDSYPLTAREAEVARLVAAGSTNRDIAAALTIAPKTVGSHIEHILAKLGAARRTEIAAWAVAHPGGD